MLYKNSIKLLFSNFNIVWKMMLYFLVVFVISGGLIFLFGNPIIKMVEDAGFFSQFVDLYADFLSTLNLPKMLQNLGVFVDGLFEFIIENISKMWFWFLGIALVVFFLNSFLMSLANMASCLSLHLYIGSLNKQGFFTSYSENFGKNFRFQLVYYLFNLPVNAIYIWLFSLMLKLFGISWIINLLAVVLLVVGSVVLFAFKKVLFASWCPAMVVLNFGIFKSLKASIKIMFRRFGRYFSNAVGIVLTILVINILLGLSTFIVGFIVSIPISYLLNNIFGMVAIYEGQGMRYYVDVYNVITPNKKESSDKLKDMKYII